MVHFKPSKVLWGALVLDKEDLVLLVHLRVTGPQLLGQTSNLRLGLLFHKEDLVHPEHLKEVGPLRLERTIKDQLDPSPDSNQAINLGQRYYLVHLLYAVGFVRCHTWDPW